jgi:hypothetical protein
VHDSSGVLNEQIGVGNLFYLTIQAPFINPSPSGFGFVTVDPVSGRSTPGRVPVMEENSMSRAIWVIMRP